MPEGADVIKIQRKNGKKAESFPINASNWKEFSLTFGLGYKNLAQGNNRYTLSFYQGEKLLSRGSLWLKSNFESRVLATTTLYIDPKAEVVRENGDIGVFPNDNAYLLEEEGDFSLLTTPFVYNTGVEILYTTKNLQALDKRRNLGDLYLNGELIAEQVPISYQGAGRGNAISFSYEPQRNYLEISYGEGDGCGYSNHIQGYTLSNKETYLELAIFKDWIPDKADWNEEMGSEGVKLEYLTKKLEVYPIFATGEDKNLLSLKYRYSLRDGEQRNLKIENFILKDQPFTKREGNATGSVCGENLFSYDFDLNKGNLIIKRSQNVGDKSETYTWKIAQIPNYYRTRP